MLGGSVESNHPCAGRAPARVVVVPKHATVCRCEWWEGGAGQGRAGYRPSSHSAAQHSTAQHSTAQHSTAQHSTAHHSTSHHSTPQHITSHHITSHRITSHHSARTCRPSPRRHVSAFHPHLHSQPNKPRNVSRFKRYTAVPIQSSLHPTQTAQAIECCAHTCHQKGRERERERDKKLSRRQTHRKIEMKRRTVFGICKSERKQTNKKKGVFRHTIRSDSAVFILWVWRHSSQVWRAVAVAVGVGAAGA